MPDLCKFIFPSSENRFEFCEMKKPDGIKAIALLEAVKGLSILIVGFGLLSYLNSHAQAAGENLIEQFHLNPAHETPTIFVRTLSHLQNKHLWLLSIGALAYALLRFVEAYGLWYHRRWAEWLAVVSAIAYLPFEVFGLIEEFNWPIFGIFALNLLIVIYLSLVLWKKSEYA